MSSPLQTLLDLRRNAEEGARQTLDLAVSLRRKEEEEQERLMARWQEARATATKEEACLAVGPSPATAAQAVARGHYLVRLRDEAARLASIAEEHRGTGLATALAAEGAAQAAYEEARKSREVIEKLKQRAEAEDRRRAERRADESASDLAQAAHFKRGSE
jgi:flagellar biosynthesis chaperone FliJ